MTECSPSKGLPDWQVVHDFSFVVGGAERVSAVLAHEVAPSQPLLSLGGDSEVFRSLGVSKARVIFPWLTESNYRKLAPMLIPALATGRISENNILASSYVLAHHFATKGAKVVYCHSPFRQMWSGVKMYEQPTPRSHLARGSSSAIRKLFRWIDRRAARAADAYIANSKVVADRIRRFYGIQPAAVIYPPIDPSFTMRQDIPRGDEYLWVGRIVEPYKRLEPVLEAFRLRPDRRLLVVGDGRDRARLLASAPPNVRFSGPMTTSDVAQAYSRAKALIFPSEDDFGLVPVEAMSTGAPVVSLRRGGPRETVQEGFSGVFFPQSDPASILVALDRFEQDDWDNAAIANYAQNTFGKDRFVHAVGDVLRSVE